MKPLKDILVVAFEQAVAAPYCTSRLADAGARVIKIERAEGDFARGYDASVGGLSSYFVWLNRGKQSLVADIKNPDDAALLHRIIARADVVVQNLAPGAAARAGFGSAALRERHPRLITVDISGYGAGNAYTDMKAYDLLVQAESGLAGLAGADARARLRHSADREPAHRHLAGAQGATAIAARRRSRPHHLACRRRDGGDRRDGPHHDRRAADGPEQG